MTEDVVQLVRKKKSGWPLSMHLLKLPGGGVLVHSPTWLGDDTFAQIDAIGAPKVLFAPNHFHHMSLPRYRERYPDAIVVASPRAIPRIEAKGHRGVLPVSEAAGLLPKGARFIEVEGVKTGETLIAFDSPRGRAWIVCDLFFNVTTPVTGFMGFVLETLNTIPGPCIGTTFLILAMNDKGAYRRFIADALATEKPKVLHLSHGDPLEGDDLAARVTALVDRRIGKV